jgi:6-phosphogluconolactonase
MPDSHLIFVSSCAAGEKGAITAFNLDVKTGTLEQMSRYGDIDGPFYLALSPDRKYLYATEDQSDPKSDSGRIVSFKIDQTTGSLTKINQQSANGTTSCYVDVDPTGKALAFANYSSGSIGSFPINSDGSLGDMVSFHQHQGASEVNTERQMGPHAHCSVISPNGRYMFACDLGIDQVLGYRLDADSATLTPTDQAYVRTIGGGGPRHFAYHPNGAYVYANNELANSVNVYSFEEASGTLVERQVIATLPDDFDEESYTADMKITPDGRFLYCSNRKHDSIAIFGIGDDGLLTLIDIQPSLGNFAQNLALTPCGSLLICANMMDNGEGENGENIVVFRIDPESGKLSALNAPVSLPSPSCTMII